MLHHPLILGPKLVFLAILIVVLVILHRYLTPGQFNIAVIIAVAAFVCFTIGLWIVALKMLGNPESRVAKGMVLTHEARVEDGFRASTDEFSSLLGGCGVTVSALRPSGIAMFNDRRVPVVTEGGFISSGSPVEVVAVEGSRVIVRKTTEPTDRPATDV